MFGLSDAGLLLFEHTECPRGSCEELGWGRLAEASPGLIFACVFFATAWFSLVSSSGKQQHSSEAFLEPEQIVHFVKFKSIFLEIFVPQFLSVYSITLFF